MRGCPGLPSFRAPRLFAAIRDAIGAASRDRFRVVQFSVQGDHLHLIVEAADKGALSAGLKGLAVRTARAVNRAAARRAAVWADRYHAHALTSPSETRRALVYVLFDFRKHRAADRSQIDALSSALWFDGFREFIPRTLDPPPSAERRPGWAGSAGRKLAVQYQSGKAPVACDLSIPTEALAWVSGPDLGPEARVQSAREDMQREPAP